jgi:hypothetical protein
VILGAGASYCYEDGASSVPMQSNIIGQLFFGASTSSGRGFPSFVGPSGLAHSHALGEFLRERYNIPEDPEVDATKLDFWSELQRRQYTLESMYEEIERELSATRPDLITDFQAIIRTAVSAPMKDRDISNVCRYHRKIVEALEPGDYIIDFNWDCLMADALLYFSHFWFPATGFGIQALPMLPRCQKAVEINSLVYLFHVHGAVILFEPEHDNQDVGGRLLFLGPKQYNYMTGLCYLSGIDLRETKDAKPSRAMTDDEEAKLARGYVYLPRGRPESQRARGQSEIAPGLWFKPVFVPPSRYKTGQQQWFTRAMLRNIHTRLPSTETIIVAGYSFPSADREHLKRIFIDGVLDNRPKLVVVNPSNEEDEFQRRVQEVFPTLGDPDYGLKDFKGFCADLEVGDSASGS